MDMGMEKEMEKMKDLTLECHCILLVFYFFVLLFIGQILDPESR